MSRYAQQERYELSNLLERVGPNAPTLCEGWRTRDLATHLIIRDSRPDITLGPLISMLADRSAKARERIDSLVWTEATDRIRYGPPKLSPARISALDGLMNTAEYFVHHEDVLRAQENWEPRTLDRELEDSLWRMLTSAGRIFYAKNPVNVIMLADQRSGHKIGSPGRVGSVRLSGLPSELLLYSFGRREHARVEIAGDDRAIEAFTAAL